MDSYFPGRTSGREVICFGSSDERMLKLINKQAWKCLFFFFPLHMNSSELQENALGTFNEFVGLISPKKGLQEKCFICK